MSTAVRYVDKSARVIARTRKEVEQRMAVVERLVVREVKEAINRGNASGKNPSEPGTPPKKVTARLFHSINGKRSWRGDVLVAEIGTDVEYGRRLELGFTGTDALGRRYNQAARPFLRTTLERNRNDIGKILGGGKATGGRGAGSPGGVGF